MNRFAFFLSLAVLVIAGSAHADSWPHRKPGLWQMTMTMQGSPMGAMTSKYCIDAATESTLIATGQNATSEMCSKANVHISGSRGTSDVVCKFGKTTSTSHTVMAFVGNTAYHSETHTHMDPPIMPGKADRTMTNDAKWVGPCPPDMKPGDMVMGNGMRMHFDPSQK